MSYLHIQNLYKSQEILLFKECFASEKIDGSSSHISYKKDRNPKIIYFAGGVSHEAFCKLFDTNKLEPIFDNTGMDEVVVFGEAYGGKCQGMSHTYGKDLRFCAFEVKMGDMWLNVPQAHEFVKTLELDFVHYVKIPTTLEAIDAERDAPSVQAKKNGIEGEHMREGVVLRPLIELTKNNGERIICKHKREEFSEREHTPKVVDPERMEVLSSAESIANEWVTATRLQHVLDKLPQDIGIEKVGEVIKAMVEDVEREAKGEILESKEARKAISKKTVELFKKMKYKVGE